MVLILLKCRDQAHEMHNDAATTDLTAALQWFPTCDDVLLRFSTSKCKHAQALAKSQYLEEVPELYSRLAHASALQNAVTVFRAVARGPAAAAHESALVEECNRYWLQGNAYKKNRTRFAVSLRMLVFAVYPVVQYQGGAVKCCSVRL